MCIRDSGWSELDLGLGLQRRALRLRFAHAATLGEREEIFICLLYTSDAADERSSVDLGGRRIIKKNIKEVSDRGEH